MKTNVAVLDLTRHVGVTDHTVWRTTHRWWRRWRSIRNRASWMGSY